jgi:amino acid adenylation domain-containing protein
VPAPAPARQGQPERRFVQLPFDAERSSSLGYAAALYGNPKLELDAFAPDDDRALAVFLAAFAAVLHRFTHQAMIACDIHREQRLAVDCEVDGDVTLSTLAARVAAALLMATSGTGLGRGMANVAVSFTDPSIPAGDAAAAESNVSPYDLNLFVHPGGTAGRATLTVRYNERLFKAATVQRLMGSFQRVLDQAKVAPDLRVGELALLSPDEEQVLRHDSGTATYEHVPVFRMVEQHARAQPQAVAARLHDASITYRELDERSNQLAHLLQARGVGEGARVAVCLGPSFDVLVSMLAIWKVGAIYVPLDPTHPEALIGMIVEEAQPAQVLTLSHLSPLTQPQRFPRFCFDLDLPALASLPTAAPAVPVTLEHASHMFYTSGTTGRPKGVLATHRNLAHYVHVALQAYRFRPDDVFISVARYTFSISLFELLCPLCSGASVRLMNRENVLAPETFAKVLEEVTVLHCGPSLMGSLFRYLRTASSTGKTFPRMRHASAGGDLVPPHIQDELKTVFPNAELFVIYGCTEISVMGCTYPISRELKATRSFVGKPFPDTAVRVMDARGALVPIGVVGEICFAGKGVTLGYYQRDELTAQKFVEREGRRFYTTGDMGRVHPDGNVEILGRRDFQVQVRGVRIELAGIENTVRELGLAGQCAVVLKKLDEQDVRLVAFVAQVDNPSVGAFRRALAARLPEYMLPQHLVILEALPLTANGKLDRDKLALLPWDPNTEHSSPAAGKLVQRTALEQQIAETMARVLKCPDVGPDADFFDQGGDSLTAVLLLLELENVLGIKLSPDILFEHSTVRALAAQAKGEFSRSPRPILLNGSPDAPAIFMLLGVHLYRELARRLEGRYAAYGVYAGRELLMFEAGAAGPTVQELAGDYIDIIRQQQPRGPYRLIGMSFGGVVAYEVAQQLRCQGEEVVFLGLLDAVLPETRVGRLMRLAWLRPGKFFQVVARRILKRFRPQPSTSAPRRAEFTRYDDRELQSPLDSRRQEAYRRAMQGYLSQVRPWKGDATLVVSGQRLARDLLQRADCGWTRHVSRLDRHTVDADHLGLLEKPKVAEVADILLAALERAETTRSSAQA